MTTMKNTLGFGLLGAGLVAPFHAKSLKKTKGGRLSAICDTDKARADKMAAEYDVKAYYSLDDMLKDPDIDVVNVLTPNHLHRDAVVRAAAAGKHILTEKPPAMTLTDTDEMIAACEKADVKFGCTLQVRTREAIQTMKKAVDTGRFGKLLHADTFMKWFRTTEYYQSDPWRSSRRSGAGVTVQHAFHYIDLLVYLMGPAVRVEAKMTNLAHPAVKLEDTVLAFIDFANGGHGVVEASTALWPGTDIRVELNGTDGTAIMSGEQMTTWQFKAQTDQDEKISNLGDADQKTAATGPSAFGYAEHKTVIQDMIDAVHEDRQVIIPVSSVRPTLELVLAMYQSAACNRPVELPVQDDASIWD